MRRLGYWLIGLIILSIVSNFFLPFVGFISIFSGILTIAMWLVYYGYISLGVLMAGKLVLERQQEKESGLETKSETKKLFGKGKHSQPANQKSRQSRAHRRRREIQHRYYTVPSHVVGRYKDE